MRCRGCKSTWTHGSRPPDAEASRGAAVVLGGQIVPSVVSSARTANLYGLPRIRDVCYANASQVVPPSVLTYNSVPDVPSVRR